MQITTISLSFKNAPLEVRENLSLQEQEIKSIIKGLKETFPIEEVIILSTCNRTELYYVGDGLDNIKIIKYLLIQKGIHDHDSWIGYFNIINDSDKAIEHIFRVGVGLESQVIGDLQITNQVKKAYQWSCDEYASGPFLHRLMHSLFYANKKVTNETNFRDGAASVSYATVDFIKSLVINFNKPKILVLGTGEIGKDVCKNLIHIAKKEVWVANRTYDKAEYLSAKHQFSILGFDEALQRIDDFDVVISSISSGDIIISKNILSKQILNFKYFIDLSIPRSIDDEIEDLPGVILYNIDQIHSLRTDALSKRKNAIKKVEDIIASAVADFKDYSMDLEVSPTINKIKLALEEIRKEELTKHLKELTQKEQEIINHVTKGMVQKIIKLPVLQLKAACRRGDADNIVDVLNQLFDLEQTSEKAISKENPQ